MKLYPAKQPSDRCPTHPGALIDEFIIATGHSKTKIAELLGISRVHLHELIAGKRPVSPPVAARLGKLFGDGADIWLKMQAAHDAWHAERETDLSSIPTLKAVA